MSTQDTNAMQAQNNNQLSILGAFANGEQFQMVMQAADMLSKSNMIPTTYQGNPGSCFIALNTALRLRMDPLMVMQNLYVVKGRPSWSGQFAIAIVNACGKFVSTWFECKNGEDFKAGVRMCAKLCSGSVVCGTWVTPEMVTAEQWGQKWKTMPEQMYQYRAAAFFARTNCPEALLGLYVEGEAEDAVGARSDVKRPLFDAADAKGLSEPAAALPPLEAESGQGEEAGPVERLMIGLSCTESELDAMISRASGGEVSGWRGLTAKQLEKLAQNPERLQAEGRAE